MQEIGLEIKLSLGLVWLMFRVSLRLTLVLGLV